MRKYLVSITTGLPVHSIRRFWTFSCLSERMYKLSKLTGKHPPICAVYCTDMLLLPTKCKSATDREAAARNDILYILAHCSFHDGNAFKLTNNSRFIYNSSLG